MVSLKLIQLFLWCWILLSVLFRSQHPAFPPGGAPHACASILHAGNRCCLWCLSWATCRPGSGAPPPLGLSLLQSEPVSIQARLWSGTAGKERTDACIGLDKRLELKPAAVKRNLIAKKKSQPGDWGHTEESGTERWREWYQGLRKWSWVSSLSTQVLWAIKLSVYLRWIVTHDQRHLINLTWKIREGCFLW